MIDRLSNALDFQAQALNLRSERQRLLASNIANADTPGYLARDIDFAGALRQATADAASPLAGLRVPRIDGSSGGVPEATLRYAVPGQTNLDGNTVDMDRERAAFAENALKYEATLRFINGQVRMLTDAMKAPGQA